MARFNSNTKLFTNQASTVPLIDNTNSSSYSVKEQQTIKPVKVTIRHSSRYQKSQLQTSSCFLPISLGQAAHENEHFAATIDLVNNYFGSCTLMLADTLQRYTMALESKYDPQHFYNRALQLGDQWLKRNEKHYSQLKNLVTITRWNDWLQDRDYPKYHDQIITTMQQDATYRQLFDITIEQYLTKYMRRLSNHANFNYERAKRICCDYLVEECVIACLFPTTGCFFEIYPSRLNMALQETKKRFIHSIYPDLMREVELRFNRPPAAANLFAIDNKRFVAITQSKKALTI